MGHFLLQMIAATPPLAWLVLAGLLALGLMQTHEQIVSRTRLALQPLAAGVFSLASAALVFGWQATVLAAWLLALAAGIGLARALRLGRRLRPLADGRVAIAGSWLPLAIYLTIYALRYAICAGLARLPELADDAGFAAAASAVYGLPIGLLAARLLHLRRAAAPAAAAWQAA